MSDWRDNHLMANALVDEADGVMRRWKDSSAAKHLLREAAQYEAAALEAVDRHINPKTYWATRISSISLWLKCGEYDKVVGMCDELLADEGEDVSQWAIVNAQEIRELAIGKAGVSPATASTTNNKHDGGGS